MPMPAITACLIVSVLLISIAMLSAQVAPEALGHRLPGIRALFAHDERLAHCA